MDFLKSDFLKGSYKYISFKESISHIRLRALQINELNNIETRFKNLKNASVFDRVTYNGKTESFREMFLEVKVNNKLLFIEVEQGVN